jgi:3-dehydroquinate synthase
MTSPERIDVAIDGGRSAYPVLLRPGLLDELGAIAREHAPRVRKWVVISDDQVAEHHGERACDSLAASGSPAPLFTFPAGEAHKNRHAWAGLTDALLAEGLGRDGGIVALGGGVTGDLAGFVAATYLRGIPVLQVPTSYVAMVDSAVGGKTGVDTPAGKNLVGAFHPPVAVVIDPQLTSTLPCAERPQGLAEAVKHGAIADVDYLQQLEADADALLEAEPAAVQRMVRRSVELKARVVSEDEREAGLREILNFGHTLGHALEAASNFGLPHGSAVSVGMVLEARLGERLGVTEPGVADRLVEVLRQMALPVEVPGDLETDAVLEFTRTDKKVRAGRVRYVLLERLGQVAGSDGWSREVDVESVRGVLARPDATV